MKILLFNPDHGHVTRKIMDMLKSFDHCSVVETIEHASFKKALLSCLSGETIVVFFVGDEKDMVFLEAVHKEFVDIKLVVNIPDRGSEFRVRALKMNPRMITETHECSLLLAESVCGIVKKELKNRTTDKNKNNLS